MPASIGVNLRVTGHCRQGGRKYMEDFFSVAYQQTEDEKDLEYAFFGIFDGHGGAEAAAFAKERLMEAIVKHKSFWSDNDEEVLRSIKLGYIETHYAMWKEQEKWPKTASGLPSTAGTTASIAFIRRGKIYIGHVGDSGIVLGYQEPGSSEWKAKPLTRDHKPECTEEMTRIQQCGGKVVAKSGVPRVVWNRPRIGHKGPVLRSTPIDEIPFLAVARSLGDLWSYNSELDEFVVSPDPDCSVIPIDTSTFRCLIFGTDGLYNMLSSQIAVCLVQQAEKFNEVATLSDLPDKVWMNPSKCLVERALELWSASMMRADNTSVVTLMLDPPGPPRAQVLRNKKKNYTSSGLQIVTRFPNQRSDENIKPLDDVSQTVKSVATTHKEVSDADEEAKKNESDQVIPKPAGVNRMKYFPVSPVHIVTRSEQRKIRKDDKVTDVPAKSSNFVLKARESLAFDPRFTDGVTINPDCKNLLCKNVHCPQSKLAKTSEATVPKCSSEIISGSADAQKYSESKVNCDLDDSKNFQNPVARTPISRSTDPPPELGTFACKNSDFESFASTSYLSMRDCDAKEFTDAEDEAGCCDTKNCDEIVSTVEAKNCCCSRNCTPETSRGKYEENVQIYEISSSSNDVGEESGTVCDSEPRKLRNKAVKTTQSLKNAVIKTGRKRLLEDGNETADAKRKKFANGHNLRVRKTEVTSTTSVKTTKIVQQVIESRLRLRNVVTSTHVKRLRNLRSTFTKSKSQVTGSGTVQKSKNKEVGKSRGRRPKSTPKKDIAVKLVQRKIGKSFEKHCKAPNTRGASVVASVKKDSNFPNLRSTSVLGRRNVSADVDRVPKLGTSNIHNIKTIVSCLRSSNVKAIDKENCKDKIVSSVKHEGPEVSRCLRGSVFNKSLRANKKFP